MTNPARIAVSIITPEVQEEAPLALLSGTFEERLQKAAAYGYGGIELVTSNPSKLDFASIKGLLEKYSLKAAAIASGCIANQRGLTLVSANKGTSEAAEALLHEMIDFASAVGAPVVTIGSFCGRSEYVGSRENATSMLMPILKRADDYVNGRKVSIALEALSPVKFDFLCPTKEAVDIISAGSFKNIGLLLDTFHMDLNHDDIYQTIADNASILCHVHIADTERLPAGLGSFDFLTLEKALKAIGYTGWQSAELARKDEPDENARTTARHIQNL